MSLFDNFTETQHTFGGPNPVNNDGSWGPGGPSSTRNLSNTDESVVFTSIEGGFFFSTPTASGVTNNVVYTYVPAVDFTFLRSINFSNCSASGTGTTPTNMVVLANGSTVLGSHSQVLPTNGSTANFGFTLAGGTSGTSSLTLQISNFSTVGTSYQLGPMTSVFLCLARGSKIKTLAGYLPVETLQRGDEVVGGRIAQMIIRELAPYEEVEIVELAPSSLEPGLPKEKTLLCSEHYLIYQGKRRLAKSLLPFPGVRLHRDSAARVLPPDEEGRYYMYDLQFEVESDYIVNGLLSQSRSPYAISSPLPRELYFDQSKYREERVLNSRRDDPPITFNYLLPNGEEVESFAQIKEK